MLAARLVAGVMTGDPRVRRNELEDAVIVL
jgi:hypothetical protein